MRRRTCLPQWLLATPLALSCTFPGALGTAPDAHAQTASVADPPQTGLSVGRFASLIGVDVNLNDTGGNGLYASLPDVILALGYLGVGQLRGGLPANPTTNFQSYQAAAYLETLSQIGYQFTLVFGDRDAGIDFERQQLDTLFAGVGGEFNGPPMRAGAVRIVEGLNEITNQSPQPTLAQATDWQRQLLCLTRQADFCAPGSIDANVAGSRVASFTSNGPVTPTANASEAFPADYANDHPYIEPSNNYGLSVLDTITRADVSTYGFTPLQGASIAQPAGYGPITGISTESGAYYEPTDSSRSDLAYLNGFDDRTRAIKTLDSIFDHISLGQASFVYQLFDNYDTTSSYTVDSDNRYGLFVGDGTTDRDGRPGIVPTAAAVAIHNVMSLTRDSWVVPSPNANNCLLHTISGLPPGASSMLLQVGDRGLYGVLLWWDNPLDWNKDLHAPEAVTGQPVTINLSDDAWTATIDLMDDTLSGYDGDTRQIPVTLGDDPLLVLVNTYNPGETCP